ncbi:hypothetical protein ACFPTR_09840 [Aliibacillus thermotolerans]|uniref:ABC transporter permease n=1 Tax=Aliibacillus thermotolerans TaxID=1834418 RepID=A0ABW0U8P4_9BACI|nr:hypothetical protein [Aliibacillus thermotolerans]MDA3130469.1 hypothetical protein [Aliibacillus thermotolerans]
MKGWKYTRSFLLANVLLLATFVFLPVLLLTDNIAVYQSFSNYLHK